MKKCIYEVLKCNISLLANNSIFAVFNNEMNFPIDCGHIGQFFVTRWGALVSITK